MKRLPGTSLVRLLVLVVASAGPLAKSATGADFSTWAKNSQIRFAGYNHPGTLTNFPALVVLGPQVSGFSYGDFLSLTNQDLRFTDSSQTTELNYEIERWDTNTAIVAATDLTSCVLWLRADLGVLTNVSGTVTNWQDQSGSGNHASTVGGAPIVVANGLTGDDRVIRLNGAGSYLKSQLDTAASCTIFTVFKDSAGFAPVWQQFADIDVSGFFPSYAGTFYLVAAPGAWLSGASPFTVGSSYLTSVIYDSVAPSTKLRKDGSLYTSQASVPGVGQNFQIGRRSFSTTEYLTGDIAEIIIYNRALSDTECLRVESYLATRYGITVSATVANTGKSYVWVQVPLLADTNTSIYAFMGKSGQTAPAYTTNGATWSERYQTVLHLQQSAGAAPDSSTNRLSAALVGAPTLSVDGAVGTAIAFSGTTQGATLSGLPTLTPYTLETWLRPTGELDNYDNFFQWPSSVAYFAVKGGIGAYAGAWTQTGSLLTFNEWAHIVIRSDGKVYKNGSPLGTVTAPASLTGLLRIADRDDAGFDYQGYMDEIRISPIIRATNWIAAAWMNQASNSLFNAYSAVQSTAAFTRKMQIVFTNYTAAEVLTNFPVLVVLTNNVGGSGFSYGTLVAPATGGDLRFYNSTETTSLNFEIESWNTNGASYVWVQVPAFSNNASIWAKWGNTSDTNLPASALNGATWSSGYAGVWHMGEGASPAVDWTANSNDGTTIGSGVSYAQTGQIDRGVEFTSGSGGLKVLDHASLDFGSGSFTVEMWERKQQSSSGWNNIAAFNKWWTGGSPGANEWILDTSVGGDDNKPTFSIEIGATTYSCPDTTSVALNTWNHIVGVRDGTTLRLYVNGVQRTTTPGVAGAMNNVGRDLYMAYFVNTPSLSLRGRLDECRVSSVARSANWLWAEWLNGASNTMFNTYGTVTAIGNQALQIQNGVASNVLATTANVTATLVGDAGVTTYVNFFYGTVNAGTNLTWAFTNNAGARAVGEVTNALSGLSSNTTYYFISYATNTTGQAVWGGATGVAFTTPSPPTVTTASGASPVGVLTATLNGNLTTGGQARVYLYWGTDVNASAYTNDLGVLNQGAFFLNASALTPETTYYYRCFATNAAGVSLSTISSFTTLAAKYYVTPSGAGAQTGVDWNNAFSSVQAALNACVDNSFIYVKHGNYPITTQLVFTNRIGVTLSGGYAGSGSPGSTTSTNSRVFRSSGNIRILYASGLTNATLERMTLTGGSLAASAVAGAGVLVASCTNFVLSACSITNNSGYAFYGDYAVGGGLCFAQASAVLTNCIVKGNSVTETDNSTLTYGGGIYSDVQCRIYDSEIALNVTSSGFTGDDAGGGVHNAAGTTLLRNCLVYGNSSIDRGDGVNVAAGSVQLNNVTLADNNGEGIYNAASASVTNCILNNNGDDVVGNVKLGFSYIEDGDNSGTNGCIAGGTLFDSGYYLATGSLAIDGGTGTSASWGLNTRTTRTSGALDSGTVDMGYHYAAGVGVAAADLYVAGWGNDATGDGTEPLPFRSITKALTLAGVGSHIHVAIGNYGTAVETFPLAFTSSGMQLLATNAAQTVIDAGGTARALSFIGVTGARIENVRIVNAAVVDGNGAGVNIASSTMVISGCTITNNTAHANGGVMVRGGGVCAVGSALTVTNCTINNNVLTWSGNSAQGYGGGLFTDTACTIVDSIIANNVTTASFTGSDGGGGVYLGGAPNVVANTLVAANGSTYGSDGVYAGNDTQLRSVTIANNGGEGLRRGAGTVTVINSILWGNGVDTTGIVSSTYCDVGVADLAGSLTSCISANPLFVNAAAGDYHEQSAAGSWHGGAWTADAATSPCIDKGNPVDATWVSEPAPNGYRINMGAYGGTAQASKSPATLGLIGINGQAISTNDAASVAKGTDYGVVYLYAGAYIDHTFTITNTGWQTLVLNGAPTIAVTGNTAEFFAVGPAISTNVLPGSSVSFTIRFMPTSVGNFGAIVSVPNSDAYWSPFVFPVIGQGVRPPMSVFEFR